MKLVSFFASLVGIISFVMTNKLSLDTVVKLTGFLSFIALIWLELTDKARKKLEFRVLLAELKNMHINLPITTHRAIGIADPGAEEMCRLGEYIRRLKEIEEKHLDKQEVMEEIRITEERLHIVHASEAN
jgi:hypothetical protein